ncbi:uncharacterized protein OCT59_005482 [Rhizophagus irregularis]|uniref:uncharacterized protein n=1 Tax=Rhizophagus irregularis TaxID=588596 RepID=UPI0033293940|nr:hypothetical protein OCT59_005482 [Rhizophagus irregularis]
MLFSNLKTWSFHSTKDFPSSIVTYSKSIIEYEAGEIKDKSCWSWIMFCSGEGNSCQHEYGGIGESHNSNISRLNLSRQVRDNIIISHRSDHRSANSVKSKLLAPFNGAEESELKEALKNQWQICSDEKLRAYLMRDDRRLKENAGPWTILHYLVIEILKPKGYVLFYQQPDLSHSEEEKHYYQLTLSNEF